MCKTKIICTIGPASNNLDTFRELVKNGLNVARLNCSHGEPAVYKHNIGIIKTVSKELNIPVAILMDTRGPEIRTKKFVGDKAELKIGSEVRLCVGDFDGDETKFCITYPTLYQDVKPGNSILLDDGLIELQVVKVEKKEIICKVINGGIIKNRKGVNVPNVSTSLPTLTEKDKSDIIYGLGYDIDYVAASFIRNANDVLEVRKLLDENNGQEVKIISKIENQEGINNIDEIIKVSDGIMVARGDLGVEIPPEDIPFNQKMIIQKCNKAEIPVITATQMLDSMINHPRPTRAEVSDVANAVLDGTDAIMLSGETAAGDYPIEAVKVMKKAAQAAENSIDYIKNFTRISSLMQQSVTNAVSHAACSTAMQLGAKAIICPTYGGRTARLISVFRPSTPIIATTANERTQRQMQLFWGVTPLLMKIETSYDILFYKAMELAKANGYVASDDLVVITAGVPLAVPGSTNLMKVQRVD
jgi:pyruvate kinase